MTEEERAAAATAAAAAATEQAATATGQAATAAPTDKDEERWTKLTSSLETIAAKLDSLTPPKPESSDPNQAAPNGTPSPQPNGQASPAAATRQPAKPQPTATPATMPPKAKAKPKGKRLGFGRRKPPTPQP